MNTETQPETSLDPVAQIIFDYKEEADHAKRHRMILNRDNWDSYHLRQDWSHKKKGQSREFLPKQAMSVEQIVSFLNQGLIDEGDWFRVDPQPGVAKPPKIDPKDVELLLLRQLNKLGFSDVMNDALKDGALGALMIAKVGGKKVTKSRWEARKSRLGFLGRKDTKLIRIDKDVWQLDIGLVRAEDYFPDPTGRGLYKVERIEMDYHELVEMAKLYPEEFDMDAVEKIGAFTDDLQRQRKARETDQNVTVNTSRKIVTIFECWGTFVDQTGKVHHKDSVAAISTQGHVIRPAKKIPFWHGKHPYVVKPIIRVPRSEWHKALMDAPTRLNTAENEIFNLMLDDGMMGVHGIKQIRTDYLSDPAQVSGGIEPGATLRVNMKCPPNVKVLERVDTSAMTQDGVTMYNLLDREYQASALTNDTRLGSLPQRQVKATEIVAANQTITGVFNGVVKMIEEGFVEKLLEKCWATMAQHMNDLDEDDVKAILTADKAQMLAAMTNQEIFAETAQGLSYKVFGLSATLKKIEDYRKYQALLQTLGTSPMMFNAFQQKYSVTKLQGEIVKSLDIDEDKILLDDEEKAQIAAQQQQMSAMMAAEQQKGQGAGGANPQSQIPQMSNATPETGVSPNKAALNQGLPGQ